MKQKIKTIMVRVLLTPEAHADGVLWVAQCLEYDIAAQGRNIQAAQRAIIRALEDQANRDVADGRVPFEGFDEAPEEYLRFFRSGVPVEGKPVAAQIPAWMIKAQEVRVC